MKLEQPLTPKQIRSHLQALIDEIQEETDWELQRKLEDIEITLGDAPTFGPTYGVIRTKKKITFGQWFNDLSPETYQKTIWEHVLIREALAFFIEDSLLFHPSFTLSQYVINIAALSKMQQNYLRREFASRAYNIRYRFIHFEDEQRIEVNKKSFLGILYFLSVTIASKRIPFKLILDTFHFFVNDPNEIVGKELEILEEFNDYLSFKPEQIIAPIRMRKITLQVLKGILQQGINATLSNLEQLLKLDYTLISKELVKLANIHNAKFWVEKNFYKLGLHYYTIIIKLKESKRQITETIEKDLLENPYIDIIYQGSPISPQYFYALMLCPHVLANSLEKRMEKRQNQGFLDYFEIKPLKDRIFMTALVEKNFKPTIESFKELLDGKRECVKLVTWNNCFLQEELPHKFTFNEKRLLKFISIYRSHSLTNPSLYSGFGIELQEFLKENNIDFNQIENFLSFMNKLRNDAIEKDLINFRLVLTPPVVSLKDLLIIKIKGENETSKFKELIDQLAIFSWIGYNITFDGMLVRVMGLDSNHKIAKMLCDFIIEKGYTLEAFTVRQKVRRYVPLDELYSFEAHLWKI
ncbi:MAG: hypothetical protein K9W42_11405 [Candidatus Heimdallarchaeota archaeon]|nr:hypothetical protein [Candidatus Heimdallarchaeota archaeon]